jgi:hypothetical protein
VLLRLLQIPPGIPAALAILSSGLLRPPLFGSDTVLFVGLEDRTTDLSGLVFLVDDEFSSASISGYVFRDGNQNGEWDDDELGLSNFVIRLSGRNGQNANIARTATTDEDGYFYFENLGPGTYAVTVVPRNGLTPLRARVGSAGGSSDGEASVRGIILSGGMNGRNYNFPLVPSPASAAPNPNERELALDALEAPEEQGAVNRFEALEAPAEKGAANGPVAFSIVAASLTLFWASASLRRVGKTQLALGPLNSTRKEAEGE